MANLECYVVFVDVVPLLETDFFSTGTSLRRNELLEVANRVVCVALDTHLQTSFSSGHLLVCMLLNFPAHIESYL